MFSFHRSGVEEEQDSTSKVISFLERQQFFDRCYNIMKKILKNNKKV